MARDQAHRQRLDHEPPRPSARRWRGQDPPGGQPKDTGGQAGHGLSHPQEEGVEQAHHPPPRKEGTKEVTWEWRPYSEFGTTLAATRSTFGRPGSRPG